MTPVVLKNGTAVVPGPSYHVVKDAAVAFTAVCLETQGSI